MADAGTQLRVGRLTKAHGLKGAIKLELYTDDPERRFVPGAEFSLQVPESSPWHGKHLTLRELRWYNGHPVGFFEGVDDRTAAESLAKAILWVSHTDDEAAEPDAWYDHQLIGLAVIRDGERIGEVTHVDHLPAQDLLIVRVDEERAKAREVMVPFVAAIVPEVDLEAGTLTVTPPAGLFEDVADEDVADEDAADEATAAPVAGTAEDSAEGESGASDRTTDDAE
ncbi:ribosome maturation factor RimM [Agromyces sp. SYSU K20354]|uniref:ribosome maturation factor RimM n=1 Tax=Agromyces cavernae TaxID=2898659 RepID=UPI001E2AB53C|nr:ribosome maturation factor RimM [Agromyces cavernae]MCD2442447.1 ribosome maturation factor RimM [Agromyces cavernae]